MPGCLFGHICQYACVLGGACDNHVQQTFYFLFPDQLICYIGKSEITQIKI